MAVVSGRISASACARSRRSRVAESPSDAGGGGGHWDQARLDRAQALLRLLPSATECLYRGLPRLHLLEIGPQGLDPALCDADQGICTLPSPVPHAQWAGGVEPPPGRR
jgi:hypothetical protein